MKNLLIILSLFMLTGCANFKAFKSYQNNKDNFTAIMEIESDTMQSSIIILMDTLRNRKAYLSKLKAKMDIAIIKADSVGEGCREVVDMLNLEMEILKQDCYTLDRKIVKRLKIVTDKGFGVLEKTTEIKGGVIKESEQIKGLAVTVDPEILETECARCYIKGYDFGVAEYKPQVKVLKWKLVGVISGALLGFVMFFFIGKHSSVIGMGLKTVTTAAKTFTGFGK